VVFALGAGCKTLPEFNRLSIFQPDRPVKNATISANNVIILTHLLPTFGLIN
jgi:hypothetical protein